jgi:hypothetical protein
MKRLVAPVLVGLCLVGCGARRPHIVDSEPTTVPVEEVEAVESEVPRVDAIVDAETRRQEEEEERKRARRETEAEFESQREQQRERTAAQAAEARAERAEAERVEAARKAEAARARREAEERAARAEAAAREPAASAADAQSSLGVWVRHSAVHSQLESGREEDVRDAIDQRLDHFRRCFSKTLSSKPRVVQASWSITDGRARDVDPSTKHEREWPDLCVVNRIRSLRLPEGMSGVVGWRFDYGPL